MLMCTVGVRVHGHILDGKCVCKCVGVQCACFAEGRRKRVCRLCRSFCVSGNRLEPKVVRTWILSGAGLQGKPPRVGAPNCA